VAVVHSHDIPFADLEVREDRQIGTLVKRQPPLVHYRELAQCHIAIAASVGQEHEVAQMVVRETLPEVLRDIIFPGQVDFLEAHDVGAAPTDKTHHGIRAGGLPAVALEFGLTPQSEVSDIVGQDLDRVFCPFLRP